MKNSKTIALLLSLILTATMISCKSTSSTNLNEGGSANNANAAVINETETVAETKKPLKTPVPTADCPATPFEVKDLDEIIEMEKYVGCALTIRGKLWAVGTKTATLIDNGETDDTKISIACNGDFTNETFKKVGSKLKELRSSSKFDQIPKVTFVGTIKANETEPYLEFNNCLMTVFNK